MGNSRQRRKQKRAQQRTVKERLWFIVEHPLLASGSGAMLLAGIAFEVSGWPILAAVFYIAAWLLLVVVFVRARTLGNVSLRGTAFDRALLLTRDGAGLL